MSAGKECCHVTFKYVVCGRQMSQDRLHTGCKNGQEIVFDDSLTHSPKEFLLSAYTMLEGSGKTPVNKLSPCCYEIYILALWN